jgi:sugar phosphate permease
MKYRYRVLGFLCLLSALTYLDRVAISVAGPRMQESLGISPQAWGWVVGIFTVSYALFEIPTGRMGDRIGARRVLTRIVLWWSAKKYVGGILGSANMVANVGGFLFSVSFGYFVKWFGSHDLALIPVALMLAIGALAWLRVDATEELIPERQAETIPESAALAVS